MESSIAREKRAVSEQAVASPVPTATAALAARGPRLNPAQELAVDFPSVRELLISASAGTGKTAVLTQRVFHLLLKRQIPPESIAMMTFTEKAAEEMRSRLEAELERTAEEAQEQGDTATLAQCTALENSLPLLEVSTIHAFCLQLLRSYRDALRTAEGALLYPEPFRVLSAEDADLLLGESYEEMMASLYRSLDRLDQREHPLAADALDKADFAADSAAGRGSDTDCRITAAFDSNKAANPVWDPHAEEDAQALEELCSLSARLRGQTPGAADSETWLRQLGTLLDQEIPDKSERGFQEELLAHYRFLRSLPHYGDWCRQALAKVAEEAANYPASHSGQAWLAAVRREAEALYPFLVGPGVGSTGAAAAASRVDQLPYWQVLMGAGSGGKKKPSKEVLAFRSYFPLFQDFVRQVATQGQALSPEALWELCEHTGAALHDWTVLSARTTKGDPEGKGEFRVAFYRRTIPLLQLLSGRFSNNVAIVRQLGFHDLPCPFFLSREEIEAGSRALCQSLAVYFALLLHLDERFLRIKQARSSIDYSDFEHLSLQILQDPEVQESLRDRYQEILIDEYQDTSPLQEEIFRAIAAPARTMVGDLKQSIYRFRHADPTLFQEKAASFAAAPEDPAGIDPQGTYRIVLHENYRLHPQLITLVNDFFHACLQKDSGEIDYDADQFLLPGRSAADFRKVEEARLQLHLLLTASDTGETTEEAAARTPEALLLPRQVLLQSVLQEQLRAGFAPGDIAILGRTHQRAAEAAEAVAALQLPVSIADDESLYERPERRLLEKLVAVLVNPLDDYALASVLRAGLLTERFGEADLLRLARESSVRSQLPEDGGSFAERFFAYARFGPAGELRERSRAFCRRWQAWQEESCLLSLSDLLQRLLQESCWWKDLQSLPLAEERCADVRDFLALAAQFGKERGENLTAFSEALERLREQAAPAGKKEAATPTAGQIRVMTMHAAKGLEFPVVIDYDAVRPSHPSPHGSFILDARHAAAAAFPDPENAAYRLRSPQELALRLEQRRAEAAEDTRLLYVTMTRAKEVLCITAEMSEKNFRDWTEQAAEAAAWQADGRFSGDLLRTARSDMDALLAWATPRLGLDQMDPEKAEEAVQCLSKDGLSVYLGTVSAYGRIATTAATAVAATGSVPETMGTEQRNTRTTKPSPELSPDAAQGSSSDTGQELSPAAASSPIQGEPSVFSCLSSQELAVLREQPIPHANLPGVAAKITVTALQEEARTARPAAAGEGSSSRFAALPPSGDGLPLEKKLRDMGLQLQPLPLSPAEELAGNTPAELSGAAYGSFLHRLFQALPLTRLSGVAADLSRERYQAFLQEAVLAELFRPSELAAAEAAWPLLWQFLHSPLAGRIRAAETGRRFLARELPFTLAEPLPEDPQETRLIQGMIDLCFTEADPEHPGQSRLILLDYKSDRLSGSQAQRDAELRRRYSVQLEIYARALRELSGQTVGERLLWLIREGRAVSI